MENHAPRAIFPSQGVQVLSAIIHTLGASILAHCFSRRFLQIDCSSLSALAKLTWPRLCVLFVFLDSWLFLFSSGILIFGIGLETNVRVCSSGIFLCIAFYTTSKVLIYFFLTEKIYIVWQPPSGSKRLELPVYVICLITVIPYAAIVVLMIVGRIHQFREDGICEIGLKAWASIPLLSYDLYINVFLTALFLWPIFRSNFANPRVRRVAVRTVIAAGIALTTSTINIAVLTVLHGKELGWVCLGSCGADVIANALAIFWVTTSSVSNSDPNVSLRLPEIRSTPEPNSSPAPLYSKRKSNHPFHTSSSQMELAPSPRRSRTVFSALTSLWNGRDESQYDTGAVQITVTREHYVVEEDLRSGQESAKGSSSRGAEDHRSRWV